MGFEDIDSYLESLDEPKRSTLTALRASILRAVPRAVEGISYGLPAFQVDGTTVAGFGAFRRHLAYLPHSGSVLAELSDDLAGFEATKGSLHFAVDEPLPQVLVDKLIAVRLRQAGLSARGG